MISDKDWQEIKSRVYFPQAARDSRFTWEEIKPDPADPYVEDELLVWMDDHYEWFDGMPRYRMTGCAHLHRDEGRCTLCGDQE